MAEGKKKVLLCDDDKDFVDIMEAVLERNGFDVRTAFNGDELMEKVHADKPDVIVLDVMMTTRSEGFDVSRELRNSEQTKDIPIIMVSSVNDTVPYKFEPDSTWLPVDAFIEKPAQPEKLLAEIRKRLKA